MATLRTISRAPAPHRQRPGKTGHLNGRTLGPRKDCWWPTVPLRDRPSVSAPTSTI